MGIFTDAAIKQGVKLPTTGQSGGMFQQAYQAQQKAPPAPTQPNALQKIGGAIGGFADSLVPGVKPIVSADISSAKALGTAAGQALTGNLGQAGRTITEASQAQDTGAVLRGAAGTMIQGASVLAGSPAAGFGAFAAGGDIAQGKGIVETGIDTAFAAITGKITDIGFKAAEPAIKEFIGKYGMPAYEKIASKIPSAVKGTYQKLASGVGKGIEKITPEIKAPKLPASVEKVSGKITGALGKVGEMGKTAKKDTFDEALRISRESQKDVENKALSETGTPRVGKQGLIAGAKIVPSPQEIKVAEAIQPLIEEGKLSSRMEPTEKQKVITTRVAQINDGLKEMIKKPGNNRTFTDKQLDESLSKAKNEFRSIFGSDITKMNAYNSVIDKYKTFLKTNNVENLLDSRQAFDSWVKRTYPKAFEEDTLTGEINPRVQALNDVRDSVNHFAADLLDEGQSAAAKKLLTPKDATKLIDKAKRFPKKTDFIRYAKEHISDYPESGFASGSARKVQAKMKTVNQYITTREEDLGELWDIANTNYSPTAGKTFTEMLRQESNLLTASENIASKMKGITKTGKIQTALKTPTAKALGGALKYGLGYEGVKHTVAPFLPGV